MDVNTTPADASGDLNAALREDIRRLGAMLGQSLTEHAGPGLLDVVERVRAAVREDPDAATPIIDGLDLERKKLISG